MLPKTTNFIRKKKEHRRKNLDKTSQTLFTSTTTTTKKLSECEKRQKNEAREHKILPNFLKLLLTQYHIFSI